MFVAHAPSSPSGSTNTASTVTNPGAADAFPFEQLVQDLDLARSGHGDDGDGGEEGDGEAHIGVNQLKRVWYSRA